MSRAQDFNLSCPIPLSDYPNVVLGHGGGGRLTAQLIEKLFLPAFDNPHLGTQHDGAVVPMGATRLAFSTDSFVVKPLFFPGGDIGTLAINGTVNDLAMCGARPLYLSAGFIIEEGLPMDTLWQVVRSMSQTAAEANVQLVTGDTKVVDRGQGDGLFVNTAGVGEVRPHVDISPGRIQAGDAIVVSGDIGRHGMAIMAVREGLSFETTITSDCAPLHEMVDQLLSAGIDVHCLRDLTRGGLASALNELAVSARVQMAIEEDSLPVIDEVRGACEILGLDPLYVANEGRLVACVPAADADLATEIMRGQAAGHAAAAVGTVLDKTPGLVTMKSRIGVDRVIDLLSGEQLPRIC